LALAATRACGGRLRVAALFCLNGVLYYATFFILSPTFAIRYYFPTYFVFDKTMHYVRDSQCLQ
jgi:hypothetical protein